MKRALYVALFVLLGSLCIYFFGTPYLSHATGFAPRTISLLAGFAVVISGIASMMLGKLAAQRGRDN